MGASGEDFIRMMQEFMESMSLQTGAYVDFAKHDDSHKCEKYEIQKGNYKTVIKVYFDDQGKMVDIEGNCNRSENKPTLNQLQEQLAEAVEAEDYLKADKIKKEIKLLEKPTE